MSKPVNLVPYYDQLSQKQKAVLCAAINRWKQNHGEQAWMHQGILPFVPRDEALMVLRLQIKLGYYAKGRALLAGILSVLEDPTHMNTSSRFAMYLSDKKVYRQFGAYPERGKVFSWLQKQKVTVGFTNKFGKLQPDNDVWLAPCVRLVKKAPGYYQVEVLAKCEKPVKEWLHANCT